MAGFFCNLPRQCPCVTFRWRLYNNGSRRTNAMPKVFGKKQARREGFFRQQRHPLGLRLGTIALPTHHGPRRRAKLELGLRCLLPRRDRKKPRQVCASSHRTLAELAVPHRVGSECPHHEAPAAPDGFQRQTRAHLRARREVPHASDLGFRRFWYRSWDGGLWHAGRHTEGLSNSRRLGVRVSRKKCGSSTDFSDFRRGK